MKRNSLKVLHLLLAIALFLTIPVQAEEEPTPGPEETAAPAASAEPTPVETEEEKTPEPTVESTPESTAQTEEDPAPAENTAEPAVETVDWEAVQAMVEENGTYQDENMEIQSLGLTSSVVHSLYNENSTGRWVRRAPGRTRLQSAGRVASFHGVYDPIDYISLFTYNGKPAYCIEPEVSADLNEHTFQGHEYTPKTIYSMSPEQRNKIGRIMWYGYGHPLTGNDPRDYIATQLLIWKYTESPYYEQIYNSVQYCGGIQHAAHACSGGLDDVPARMDAIMNLVENHDTVPSFGDEWHGVKHYDLDWSETLTLHDNNNVLNWFKETPEEGHPGINIKVEGNDLKIDIDDLYYAGYDSMNGKTLTFKRKDDQWTQWLNGVLLWEAGAGIQRTMSITGFHDPTPAYQLSFSLKRADLEFTKLDEYGVAGNLTAGTTFYVGWYEDPGTQYLHQGLNDPNWHEIHDPNKPKRDDVDGSSNVENTTRMYYPIMTPDGSAIRTFQVGADGKLHISGLLPRNKKWWIREVSATNPYVYDGRAWSASAGDTGTTTSVAMQNALRDVTLSLVKRDEEDQFQHINGATYRIWEVGNLDLNRDPSQLGTEVNLNRLHNPTLTYQQLKENTNLKTGDTFIFNGYVYEIKEVTDHHFTVTAIKQSAYNMADDNVFSRYQFISQNQQADIVGFSPANVFAKQGTYTVHDIQKRHATQDIQDDETNERKMNITSMCANLQNADGTITPSLDGEPLACKIQVTEDRAVSTTFNAMSTPNKTDFETAAADQNVPLQAGNIVTVNHIRYKINSVHADRITATPMRDYTVDLTDARPAYFDIPHVRYLKAEDTFTLKYPVTTDGIHYTPKEQQFKVLTANAYELVIETVPTDSSQPVQTFHYTVPDWIDYEDIPAQIDQDQKYTILSVTNPSYIVTDSRGNKYEVKSSGTTVLENNSGDAEITDVDYLFTIGSYTTDADGHITEDPAGLTNSGCADPANLAGCPLDTVRTKKMIQTKTQAYTGIQYADEHGASRPEGDSFTAADGVTYTVLDADDGNQITLGYVGNGKTWEVTLINGSTVTSAIHKEEIDVDFTIIDRADKEFDISWDTVSVPTNSLTTDPYIHLAPSGNDTGIIRWQDIPNPSAPINTTFTTANGVAFTVLYNDTINHKMIVQCTKGRFAVTPSGTVSVMPIDYDTAIAAENQRGTTLVNGDTLTNTYQKNVEAGDTFYIENTPYTVLTHEYENRTGTTTLSGNTVHQYKLIYPWEKDAPYSYAQIIAMAGGGTSFTDDHGTPYTWTTDTQNGNTVYVLDNGLKKWVYSPKTVTDTTDKHAAYENREPKYTLTVQAPTELTYAQYINAKHARKEKGDQIEIGGRKYKIKQIEDVTTPIHQKKITFIDEAGNTECVLYETTVPSGVIETVVPFSYTDYEAADKLLDAGDFFHVNGTRYQVLKKEVTANHGESVTIKNTLSRKTLTILENPDSNFFETERIYTFTSNTEHNLSNLWPNAYDMKLESGNMHITLTSQDNGAANKTVTLKGDANTTAVILLVDKDGNVTDRKRIVLTSGGTTGRTDGLLNFEGQTGRQYLRLVDPQNHNTAMPYGTAKIYKDASMRKFVKQVSADANGVVDVSDWEAGTYYYKTEYGSGTVHVVSADSMNGQLKVSGLKWGRTYMACELSLPEGYDYGNNEVCHAFTMNADEHTDVINAEAINRRRRLDMRVYKVDQDDQEKLLNGAWFTVSDVTDTDTVRAERESSTFRERIDIRDIPDSAQLGDQVVIWRAKQGGKNHRYRITNVDTDFITIQLFDNNREGESYNIPKIGYSATAPMLYTDIVRTVSKVKKGAVFIVKEKEPVASIRTYEILAIHKVPGTDIFGNPTGTMVVGNATVQSRQETNAEPIRLQAIHSNERYEAEMIGKYMTGGIFTEILEDTNSVPLGWNDLMTQIGGERNLHVGTTVSVNERMVAAMPRYDELESLLQKSFGEITVGMHFTYGDVVYTVAGIESTNPYIFKLSALGKEYVYSPQTQTGAVSYTASQTMKVEKIYHHEDGNIVGVSIQDTIGNSFFIRHGETVEQKKTGKPGVEVKVSVNADMSNPAYIGYTDGNGQLAIADVPDGEYYVSRDGTVTKETVEKGVIRLPEVKYGHKVKICETKSPLGYVIGNACSIIEPKADYTTDVVKNYRTNMSIQKKRRLIRKWKMGVEE